jgi:hypothetical protein
MAARPTASAGGRLHEKAVSATKSGSRQLEAFLDEYSLAAFGRRPRCPLTGRVGRHPKPITDSATELRGRRGGRRRGVAQPSKLKPGRMPRGTRLRCNRADLEPLRSDFAEPRRSQP